MKQTLIFLLVLMVELTYAQDLSKGLRINDLTPHPMQEKDKPGYLDTIIDPSFGTTIRRITNAGDAGVIVPMYSTIQAWNADESMMILYNQTLGVHQLLNGMDYTYIRDLDDVTPYDIEGLYWSFSDPDLLFYLEKGTGALIKYVISSQSKEILANLDSLTADCNGSYSMGNDVHMSSWDSDVFGFRCNNDAAYYYKVSEDTVVRFEIADIAYAAPMPGPSGETFYHNRNVYDRDGQKTFTLNQSSVEHSSLGQLANGNDAYFAIAFAEGPNGGCIGDVIAHDLETGVCIPIISESQGYDYPQSGTHISAVAHKNTEGGWLTASMMGYDKDGQSLLDQEIIIARADEDSVIVCRIAHHRSDEDQFDYWGEPHATISPSGTRVLFASDWSGLEDGRSVDSYVVELPAFEIGGATTSAASTNQMEWNLLPNPMRTAAQLTVEKPLNESNTLSIYNLNGQLMKEMTHLSGYQAIIEKGNLPPGMYVLKLRDDQKVLFTGKIQVF